MNTIVKSAIMGVLALSVAGTASAAKKPSAAPEKCYGIVKAGLNDCETSNTSCAGSSKRDNQPDAYIWLPKGACGKIVGGSLSPKK